jgi:hypothetical protein
MPAPKKFKVRLNKDYTLGRDSLNLIVYSNCGHQSAFTNNGQNLINILDRVLFTPISDEVRQLLLRITTHRKKHIDLYHLIIDDESILTALKIACILT